MENAYTHIPNIAELVKEVPPDTIVSRTFYEDDQMKSILFAFAAGQELSEHTAAKPAILHFLSGEADLILGDDSAFAQEGTWVHMPPNLPHSVMAKTQVLMLLMLLG